MESELLGFVKKEEPQSDEEYEFQFQIKYKDYQEVIKRIFGDDIEDSDDSEDPKEVPTCPECQKTFTRKNTLKRHMVIHDPNRLESCAICDVCGKLIKGSMKVHLETHTDFKPFTCEMCAKRFRRKGALKRHLYLHSRGDSNKLSRGENEKPFKCMFCTDNRSFMKKYSLQEHLATNHADQMEYQCEICSYRTDKEENLLKHENSHARPFLCEMGGCRRQFSHKRSMLRHQRDKHQAL